MFLKNFKQPRVDITARTSPGELNSSITLTPGLSKYLAQQCRSNWSEQMKGIIESENGDAAQTLIEEAFDDFSSMKDVVVATEKELHRTKAIISALERGHLPDYRLDADPEVSAALEVYGLVELFKQKSPDTSVELELRDTLNTLKDLRDELADALEVTRDRVPRVEEALQRVVKTAFAFAPNVGTLIEKGYHKHLPEKWRSEINATKDYALADFDRYSDIEENLNASILQFKFREFSDMERKEFAARHKRDKRSHDAIEFSKTLDRIYSNDE